MKNEKIKVLARLFSYKYIANIYPNFTIELYMAGQGFYKYMIRNTDESIRQRFCRSNR